MKNNSLFYLLVVFTLLNIMDVITTMFILKAESNPLYHLFGNIYVPIFLKIVVLTIAWRWYFKNIYPNNFSHYLFITIMVFGCVTLLIAQIGNVYGIMHPAVIEKASTASVSEKVNSYFQFVGLIYLLPILFNLGTFLLYESSRKKIIISKKYYKNIRWWQFW